MPPLSQQLPNNRFVLRGPDGSTATVGELRAAYRQGFVLEMIDTRHAEQALSVFVFALNPVQYTLSEPFQVQLTPAEDNTVVAEENGIIVREIMLAGTFGISNKTATGFMGAQGNGQAISGNAHFSALRDFFRDYSARKKDPQQNAHIRMLFHALRDDDHFVVIPKSFETPRDSQRTRVHYEYRITLSATNEAIQSALQADTSTDRISGFDSALSTVAGAFNDARAAIAEVTADLAMYRRKVANIQTVMVQASQLVNAVGGLVSGATTGIDFPGQLAGQIATQLETAEDDLIGFASSSPLSDDERARTLRRLNAAIDQIMQNGQLFAQQTETIAQRFIGERGVTQDDVAQSGTSGTPGAGGATIGSRTRAVAGGTDAIAGLDIPTGTGFRSVEVRRTDTIESIAIRARVSVESVIVLNNLRPPYIVPGGGPGFAQVGDTLIVPGTGTGAPMGAGPVGYLTPDEALFGIDLALDQQLFAASGTFDLVENSTLDDFATVGGIQNVVQGTEITINIERGTEMIPELGDIGIRRNVGTKGTIQHVLLASLTLREALSADPRVTGIASSRVVLDGDVLTQEITPIVGGSRAGAPFVLPFGNASDGA